MISDEFRSCLDWGWHMALTPEQRAQIARDVAANRARQAEINIAERLEAGEVTLELVRTSEDAPVNDETIQAELSAFGRALRSGGVQYSQLVARMDAVDAHSYTLAEFIVKNLGPPAITAIAAAVSGWFAGRSGRKARVKVGDIEAEAQTPEEVEKLLKCAIPLLEARKDKKR